MTTAGPSPNHSQPQAGVSRIAAEPSNRARSPEGASVSQGHGRTGAGPHFPVVAATSVAASRTWALDFLPVKWGWSSCVMAATPEALECVLGRDRHHFDWVAASPIERAWRGGAGSSIADDDPIPVGWAASLRCREFLTPSRHAQGLIDAFEATRRLLVVWDERPERADPVNDLIRLALELVARIVLGASVETDVEGIELFARSAALVRAWFDAEPVRLDTINPGARSQAVVGRSTRSERSPSSWGRLLPAGAASVILPRAWRIRKAAQEWRLAVDGEIDRRSRATSTPRDDLLSHLLGWGFDFGRGAFQDTHQTRTFEMGSLFGFEGPCPWSRPDGSVRKDPLGPEAARERCLAVLLDGVSQIVGATLAAWGHLAFAPELESHLIAEAVESSADQPDGFPEPGGPWSAAIVHEARRLHPARVLVARRVIGGPLPQAQGAGLADGATVLICPWLTHRDPRWFADPEGFVPERWLIGLETPEQAPSSAPPSSTHPLPVLTPEVLGEPTLGDEFLADVASLVLMVLAPRFRLAPESLEPDAPWRVQPRAEEA